MSSIAPGGYDKTIMARDLARLLDSLGIERVFPAGYDLGAGTAAAFARDYPQRVARVTFMEFGLIGFDYEVFMAAAPRRARCRMQPVQAERNTMPSEAMRLAESAGGIRPAM
jgi:pimeloyl-ACP methyl ester carboxylesterase